MDDIDIRILNLERFVIHLKAQIASTNQRALANSTLLNNSGPMAGTTSGAGAVGAVGGSCGGLVSPTSFQLSSSTALGGTCGNGDSGVSICPNSHRDYSVGTDCVIRVYNMFSVSIPASTTMVLSPVPDLGDHAYAVIRTI